MTTWNRSIRRITANQMPAWRVAMSATNTLYNVSGGGPSDADASISWPAGTETPSWQFAGTYGFGAGAGADVISGYASGTLLEDVGGVYGTMVYGTGGHSRFQNQLLSLNLSDDSPTFGWFQQPQYQVSSAAAAAAGAEIYYNPTEAATFPSNRLTQSPLGGDGMLSWDGGFPMATLNGWIHPAKLTYGQLGNNNPHGFRYGYVAYVPPEMTGNGAGALIASPLNQGPYEFGTGPTGSTTADMIDAASIWPSGRRKFPLYWMNVQTKVWSRFSGWVPDYVTYGYVSRRLCVDTVNSRVYAECDEAGGTATYFYIDMASGIASATVSSLVRPSGTIAPFEYSVGAFTTGHPTLRLFYFPNGSNLNGGLVMQDMATNENVTLNFSGLSLNNSERVGITYDLDRHRLYVVDMTNGASSGVITVFTVTIPADPRNAAGYTVSSATLTIDGSVSTPLTPAHAYSKVKYIRSLGVVLIPQVPGKMLGFVPAD